MHGAIRKRTVTVAEVLEEASPAPSDPRPVVRTASANNLGIWVFMGLLLLGGLWIVSVMSDARQAGQTTGSSLPVSTGPARISSSAPPALPPWLTGNAADSDRGYLPPAVVRAVPRSMPQNMAPPAPVISYQTRTPQPVQTFAPPVQEYRDPLPQLQREQPVILNADQQGTAAKASAERVNAGRLQSPSLTVPLGTIIPAVLETAFDSTRAGSVRALVQRDVRSFDGSRVLIPRGSRLYGEYEGALADGQNRALVTWTRLLRPDGVTIALDSQASDPLGRAGIRGKVDSKFLQRFGGAILQSVLDIGVGLATRSVGDGVIVALPGSTQNLTRVAPSQITPTLRVKQGTSVSVYVGRDLDFSAVDG